MYIIWNIIIIYVDEDKKFNFSGVLLVVTN